MLLKSVVLPGLLAGALLCGQAMAQTDSAPAGAPPAANPGVPSVTAPAVAPAPAGGATSGAPTNKEIIAGCRNDAQAKGLKGPDLQSAVRDCVSAQKPKLAARMACAQQGRAQGVAKGDAMKAFVKNCLGQGQ